MAAFVLVATLVTPGPGGSEPAAAQPTDACTNAPTLSTAGLLLPPWSDLANWNQPNQYVTIQVGDLDGDGVNEIVGNDGTSLEIYSWSTSAGQWVPSTMKLVNEDTVGAFPNELGWVDPVQAATIQVAQLDGSPGDEVIAVGADGLEVWARGGDGNLTKITVAPDFIGVPAQGGTVRTGDLDGDGVEEIVARFPGGIRAYQLNGGAVTEVLDTATVGPGPVMSDGPPVVLPTGAVPGAWQGHPSYYGTIQLADVDGDGSDELLGRGHEGLEAWKLLPTPTLIGTIPDLSDANGWRGWGPYAWLENTKPADSITTGDVDGDGADEVVAVDPASGPVFYGYEAGAFAPTAVSFDGQGPWNTSGNDANRYGLAGDQVRPSFGDLDGDGKAEMVVPTPSGIQGFGVDIQTPSPVLLDPTVPRSPADVMLVEPVTAGGNAYVMMRGFLGVQTRFLANPAAGMGMLASSSAPWPSWAYDTANAPAPDPDNPNVPSGQDVPPEEVAYFALSQKVGALLWSGATTPQGGLVPIRDRLLTDNLLVDIDEVQTQGERAIDAAKPEGLGTVDRATWDNVANETKSWVTWADAVNDWYNGADRSLAALAQYRATSVSDLFESVAADFEIAPGKTQNWSILVSDLVWGFVGSLGGLAAVVLAPVTGGTSLVVVAALVAVAGMEAGVLGGALGAWITFATEPSSGNANVIAGTTDEITEQLANAFCGAVNAYDLQSAQIVADYGLLVAGGQATQNGTWSFTSDQCPDDQPDCRWLAAKALVDRSAEIWMIQQYANVTTEAGWSSSDPGSDISYNVPGTERYYKFKKSGDCRDLGTEKDRDLWARLGTLGVDPGGEIFTPVDAAGEPAGETMGINGWRLRIRHC